MSKPIPVRLDSESAEALEVLTHTLGVNRSEIIRRAIMQMAAFSKIRGKRRIFGCGIVDSGVTDLGSNKQHLRGTACRSPKVEKYQDGEWYVFRDKTRKTFAIEAAGNHVGNVGLKGDVIRVRDGFARNFLLPRGLAQASTRANQKFVEEQKVRVAKKRAKERTAAEGKVNDLEKLKLTFEVAAGEQDKLFGSVTTEEIRQALTEQGYPIEKKRIHLKEPIRTLGSHTVIVELYPQVKATLTVEVIRKS